MLKQKCLTIWITITKIGKLPEAFFWLMKQGDMSLLLNLRGWVVYVTLRTVLSAGLRLLILK